MENLERAGLDAVDRFISTWNSRDPATWADSLNYPHVRPAPDGPVRVVPDAGEYAAGVDFDKLIASGWDHSEWDYKHVLHVSPRRIHVAGQWSRYTTDGSVIATTPVLYVCTKVNGTWGIQSRFAADYVDEDTDTTEIMTRGLALVQDFINRHNESNRDACAELLNYPHLDVGVGEVEVTESAADFRLGNFQITADSMMGVQTGRQAMNVAAELTVNTDGAALPRQAVININNRDGHLGIQAWSLLDPTEETDDPD